MACWPRTRTSWQARPVPAHLSRQTVSCHSPSMTASHPLSGLTVVSLEQAVAAPYCSSRLADAGARVIKIERPEGDFARGYDKAAKRPVQLFRLAQPRQAEPGRRHQAAGGCRAAASDPWAGRRIHPEPRTRCGRPRRLRLRRTARALSAADHRRHLAVTATPATTPR